MSKGNPTRKKTIPPKRFLGIISSVKRLSFTAVAIFTMWKYSGLFAFLGLYHSSLKDWMTARTSKAVPPMVANVMAKFLKIFFISVEHKFSKGYSYINIQTIEISKRKNQLPVIQLFDLWTLNVSVLYRNVRNSFIYTQNIIFFQREKFLQKETRKYLGHRN